MNKLVKKLAAGLLAGALALGMLPGAAFAAAPSEPEGSFTVCSMNVDGLPNKIWGFPINSDGPGSDGTKAISAKMATYGWDIIGVSEDFNYNTELMSSLTNYSSGTHRGGVSRLSNNTDGLNLIWKNSISVSGEKWTSWNTHYSTGPFETGNGADGMIDKGYRYYQATLAEGVAVDVYILHMDADSDAGDISAREAQLTQLANAIKASDNKNPIIVMGDTNCRYTREQLQTLFIDAVTADERFTALDVWVEKVRNNEYPTYGAEAIVAKDKGGMYDYPDAEIVDKVFYINNTESDITLTADSYTIATDFTDASGNALADHWPVVVEFSYSAAHEHQYVEEVTTEATCTAAGEKTFTCECGDSYTETIPALNHDYQVIETKPATCTAEGSVVYSCSRCDDTYSETLEKTEHQYEAVTTKEPTCVAAGVKTYTCKDCGDSYTEAIPATGIHTVNDVTTKEPTCTEDGYTTAGVCVICGQTITEATVIPALGHDYNEKITKEATCTETGTKTFTCSRCDDSYTEVIPALGHDYNENITKEATCTENGTKTYTCSRGDDVYTEVIPATGHTEETVSAKEATCTEAGYTESVVCSVCGEVLQEAEEIIALGHSYEVTTSVEATCEEDGKIGYTCSNCGDYYEEVVTATGHQFENGVCVNCGISETTAPVLGEDTKELVSGKRYVIAFHSTVGKYVLGQKDANTIEAQNMALEQGDEVDSALIWTLTEQDGGYVLSTEIDGKTRYLYRTKTFTGSGYRVGLCDTPTVWTVTNQNSSASLRFYTRASYGSTYYLRYYNERIGWQASVLAAGIHLYEVDE